MTDDQFRVFIATSKRMYEAYKANAKEASEHRYDAMTSYFVGLADGVLMTIKLAEKVELTTGTDGTIKDESGGFRIPSDGSPPRRARHG